MENSSAPRRCTRAGQKAAEEVEKLEEQRNYEACPWVIMVGKGEQVRQRHADKVHDERRRELDAIERGEGVPTVKEVLEEENILDECEENRHENDHVEHEDADIKEENTDCDEEVDFEDCTLQYKNKLPEGSAVALEMDWLQEVEMKEELGEEQEQSLCVGEGGAGCEGLILIDHEQEEGGVDGAQAVIGSDKDGEGDEIVEQRVVNNSGQSGEGEAHLDENQNKKSDQDLLNKEAEDPVVEKFCHRNLKKDREVVSELVRKYSLKMLKKIGFELGNAIKTACGVSREPGGVGNVDSFGVNEQELLNVGGEIHTTEVNSQLRCSEPSLKPASHVETGLGDQDATMDNVFRCKEHAISVLPVFNVETVNDVEEGADKQCQVKFDCIDNGPAQAYSGEQMGNVGHGRVTSSMLRDVDEEAVDDVEPATDHEVELPLDRNENGSAATDIEMVEETTSTQLEVKDSSKGCVKKAQHKKRPLNGRSFSCQEGGCQKKFPSMSRLNAHVTFVHLKNRPFSCQEDGCRKKFKSKTYLDEHITAVHHKKKPFSCKEEGCHKKFAAKRKLIIHVNEVHLKMRPFSCKEDGCKAKFGRKTKLNEHFDQVHLKKKPFKCSHCSKDFGYKQTLTIHIKVVHQKEKAFICQERGCGRKFGQKQELPDHMRSVHGAPKLVCQKAECSATFAYAYALYRHMKRDHEGH